MGVYTVVPVVYACASIGVVLVLTELDWFGAAFVTFGPAPNATQKTFCGRPIRSARQYYALIAISCMNSLLSTFYNELM